MNPLTITDELFFGQADARLDRPGAERILGAALAGSDDGELFLEYRESETVALEDGRIRSAGFDTAMGFGLRSVAGEATGYAHAAEISEEALKRAAESVAPLAAGRRTGPAEPPRMTNARLYSSANPLSATAFESRTALLAAIDAYARSLDGRVVQVMASLGGEWQAVQIMRPNGTRVADLRPLVRLNVSIVVEQGGRRETGTSVRADASDTIGFWTSRLGGRLWTKHCGRHWSIWTPACARGRNEVVLGPGWPGILLHEAIGHGLEGDFNRKKTSAFAGLLGERSRRRA